MAAGLVDRDDVGGQVLDDDERAALLDELLGPDPGRYPAQPRRRRPWLRWLATVGVAFVAAVTILVGPTTTWDAAQAVTIPPIVAAIGEEGALPATILEFNPAGFAVTAVAILAWVAWDNRATLAQWGHNAWCFLSGGSGCSQQPLDPSGGSLSTEVHPTSPYTSEKWTVTHGAAVGTLNVSGVQCTQYKFIGSPPPNLCDPTNEAYGSGATIVICKATAATPPATGAVIVGRGSTTASGTSGWYGNGGQVLTSGVSLAAPNKWDAKGHTDFVVCPSGYDVVRAIWYNITAGATTDLLHGSYSNGSALPTDTRLDVTCKRSDGSTYVVQGPITTDSGDHSAGFTVPACVSGDTEISTTVNSRTTGDSPWTQTVVPDVAPLDQVPQFGDCLNTDGTANGKCETNVSVNGKVCTVGNVADCWDWKSEVSTGANVQCVWGPLSNPAEYSLPMSNCDPLTEMYRTGKVGTTNGGDSWYSSNADGTPSPYTGNVPVPATSPVGGSSGAGSSSPGGSSGVPTTGTNPGTAPVGSGNPDSSDCWGTGWDWNPVSWVVIPVKCTLLWAFVPDSQTLQDQVNDLQTSLRATSYGPWIFGIVDTFRTVNLPGDGSCRGPDVRLPDTLGRPGGGTLVHASDWYPLDTCSEPMATAANVTRTVVTIGIWIAVVIRALNRIASALGMSQLKSSEEASAE